MAALAPTACRGAPMGQRFLILLAAAWLLLGCGSHHRTYDSPCAALPQPCGARPARTPDIVVGAPGDRWLDVMPSVQVAPASRDGRHGYQVTYASGDGASFTLFWTREQIDFAGRQPHRYGRRSLAMPGGQLWYPTRVTAESLPDVYCAILSIEHDLARDVAGATAAASAFANLAALGGPGPPLRRGPAVPPAGAAPLAPARIVGTQAAKQGFKPLTQANFRHNLGQLTGRIPKDAHAHHVFPQQFIPDFRRVGINIHDPRYGAWWQAAAHQKNAATYNKKWEAFLDDTPTLEQILQFGRKLAHDHGFQIYF